MMCECGCGQTTRPLGWIKGQPNRFVNGHNHRKATVRGYRVAPGSRNKVLHIVRAEAALGHPLPAGAHVHHADGSRSDNAPLVICQDAAYHRFLHFRMRIVRAGGNPNTQRICRHCQRVLYIADFGPSAKLINGGPIDRCCPRCAAKRMEIKRRAMGVPISNRGSKYADGWPSVLNALARAMTETP